jgi:hypothetical protein
LFGWNIGADLYIIPDHGRQIVKTDPHNVAHVYFREQATTDKFTKIMFANGFDLPEDMPDATFKQPD